MLPLKKPQNNWWRGAILARVVRADLWEEVAFEQRSEQRELARLEDTRRWWGAFRAKGTTKAKAVRPARAWCSLTTTRRLVCPRP